jgi:hypothetical protein
MHRVGLAALSAAVITATSSVWGYDLQYRKNNTDLSAAQLQQAFNRGLPSDYDRLFPQQQWTTYALIDGHTSKGLVAITLGLSPKNSSRQSLLPVATYSFLEPVPLSPSQWDALLAKAANTYGSAMVRNSQRILTQR